MVIEDEARPRMMLEASEKLDCCVEHGATGIGEIWTVFRAWRLVEERSETDVWC